MTFILSIAWSHLRSRRQDVGISLIGVLSVIGVTAGVAVLDIVLSVMTGFEVDLRTKILGSNAHMMVIEFAGTMDEPEPAIEKVKAIDGVEAVAPFVYTEVMLRSAYATSGAVLKGLDPVRTAAVTDVVKDLKVGPQGHLNDAAARLDVITRLSDPPPALAQDIGDTEVLPGILLGEELAAGLRVYPGDRVFVINPIGGGTGPFGVPMPTTRTFRVAGIFYTGMYEYDTKWSYVSIADAQAFTGLGTAVTGLELRVEESRLYEVDQIGAEIEAALGSPYITRNWLTMNAALFSALKLEKIVMVLILGLIMVVAALGIVTNLVVMVITRAREISILKAMGASDRAVLGIFITQGMIVGVVGTSLGTALGLAGSAFLDQYQFPLDTNVYYLDSLPVVVEYPSVAYVALGAMVICFLATLYPAWRAANLHPVDGLRYE